MITTTNTQYTALLHLFVIPLKHNDTCSCSDLQWGQFNLMVNILKVIQSTENYHHQYTVSSVAKMREM